MKQRNYLTVTGIGLLLAGSLLVLALTLWWLRTGDWLALSSIDALGLMSPIAAAWTAMIVSDFDIFYFVFAEAPLYSVLLISGAILLIGIQIARAADNKWTPKK